MSKQTALLPLVHKFFEHDAAAAAHSLERMDDEQAIQILAALPPTLASRAFPHLQLGHAIGLLQQLPPEPFREIVQRLTPKQAASVFTGLSKEAQARMLHCLPEKEKRQLQELLVYPEDSAGRIMSTDFLSFSAETKVRDAVRKIRLLAQKKTPLSYTYVVDVEGRLLGVVNMHDLLLAPNDAELASIIRKEVFSVNGFMDREEIANLLSKKRYFAVPVLDNEKKLLGIVRTEGLIQAVQEEGVEDLQKIFGVHGDERVSTPLRLSLHKRLPWLHLNLVTAFMAAAVVALFEDVIAQITVLAVFLPVVAGQGGNAGAQSLAVVMRGLVMREIPVGRAKQTILKETAIGAINGLVIGVVVAVISWAWRGIPFLGVVVGLGMFVNLVIAGFSGATIPLAMKAMGKDPAQSANIILTTITDVIGFLAFLGFAVLFRGYLVP